MPKAITCELNGQVIGVDQALQIRERYVKGSRPYPEFRCRECGELVRPHKTGTTGQAAHFEHRSRNPNCSQGV